MILTAESRQSMSTPQASAPMNSSSTTSERQPQTHLNGMKNTDFVNLGLLIPKQGTNADDGLAAKRGAEMALVEANNSGGCNGRPFKLIIRSNEGLWGSGSNEIVKLVFEEGVWAILGTLDGRSAHLAEQIITKGQVVLVSPWATDPTLTQINIPWFFRCVPDDRQQAKVLVKEIFQVRQLQRVAMVASEEYDARVAAAIFAHIAEENYSPPLQFFYEIADPNFHDLLVKVEHADVEAVVLFGQPWPSKKLVQSMRARGINWTIFGPMNLADEKFLCSEESLLDGVVLIAPAHWFTFQGKKFLNEYKNIYGDPPRAVAAYAYDGMRLIVAAIRIAGLDREKIQEAIANIEDLEGVTGLIEFDAKGNRIGPVHLIEAVEYRR